MRTNYKCPVQTCEWPKLGKKCNVRDALKAKTYQFSFPVFPFEQSAALCAVVVVDVQRVGEGTEESALAFDELHVPAAPDHVVQPEGDGETRT